MAQRATNVTVIPALAIFVKTPGLSPVKTRLAATLGTANAMLFHTLAAAATAEVASSCESALMAYWAVAEVGAGARAAWPELAHVEQGAGDLGARLHHVYATLQARHGRVLLIGADAPQLTSDLLHDALCALGRRDDAFVMGRAADGGFWLFGGRVPIPRSVWQQVRYSQSDTASQLRSALATQGTIALVPQLTDVDDAADLGSLAAALAELPAPLPAQRRLADWLCRLLGEC